MLVEHTSGEGFSDKRATYEAPGGFLIFPVLAGPGHTYAFTLREGEPTDAKWQGSNEEDWPQPGPETEIGHLIAELGDSLFLPSVERVRIIRDNHGIPHIYGATDVDPDEVVNALGSGLAGTLAPLLGSFAIDLGDLLGGETADPEDPLSTITSNLAIEIQDSRRFTEGEAASDPSMYAVSIGLFDVD